MKNNNKNKNRSFVKPPKIRAKRLLLHTEDDFMSTNTEARTQHANLSSAGRIRKTEPWGFRGWWDQDSKRGRRKDLIQTSREVVVGSGLGASGTRSLILLMNSEVLKHFVCYVIQQVNDPTHSINSTQDLDQPTLTQHVCFTCGRGKCHLLLCLTYLGAHKIKCWHLPPLFNLNPNRNQTADVSRRDNKVTTQLRHMDTLVVRESWSFGSHDHFMIVYLAPFLYSFPRLTLPTLYLWVLKSKHWLGWTETAAGGRSVFNQTDKINRKQTEQTRPLGSRKGRTIPATRTLEELQLLKHVCFVLVVLSINPLSPGIISLIAVINMHFSPVVMNQYPASVKPALTTTLMFLFKLFITDLTGVFYYLSITLLLSVHLPLLLRLSDGDLRFHLDLLGAFCIGRVGRLRLIQKLVPSMASETDFVQTLPHGGRFVSGLYMNMTDDGAAETKKTLWSVHHKGPKCCHVPHRMNLTDFGDFFSFLLKYFCYCTDWLNIQICSHGPTAS